MDWGFAGTESWHDDQRARRGIFKDRDTHHSHGSYPRTDNLHFYLSYHAMMVVAGHLLSTLPLHLDPEDSWGDFEDWFSRHDLTRTDGDWLADRRDPTPLEWADWKDETLADDWRWSLASADFDKTVFRSDGKITVWGDWTTMSGQRQETVHIASALVSSDRAQALLRALQTATNPHDYRLPDAGDDAEIDQGEFRVKGWVVAQTNEGGIDKLDPWAGDIRFPPIRPAEFIGELMGISSDPERRVWSADFEDRTQPVFWSRVWGHFADRENGDGHESGQRFDASSSCIRRILRSTGTDLLVEIQVSRQSRYSRYSHRDDDGPGYIFPYAKLFLIRGDGSVLTV